MNKFLKFGLYFGVVASIVSCGTSEHFMQDDVYSTRTPMMPPGTDLNDVTDYATYVAKKEQTEAPQEQTAYVSPREYTDYFYRSQYVFYGYTPFSIVTGMGYAGYTGISYHPQYGYTSSNMSYPYGYSSAFYGYGYGYGYGSGYTPPYYSGYYYGNHSGYAPISKPSTGKNSSRSSAMIAGGRGSNMAPAGYKNQLMANSSPNVRYERAVVSPSSRTSGSSPVNVNNNTNRAKPTVNRGQGQVSRPVVNNPSTREAQRSDSYNQRPIVSGNSDRITRPTVTNSTNNNTPARTSTPVMRSGGSGGSTPSSGGSRSGGRR